MKLKVLSLLLVVFVLLLLIVIVSCDVGIWYRLDSLATFQRGRVRIRVGLIWVFSVWRNIHIVFFIVINWDDIWSSFLFHATRWSGVFPGDLSVGLDLVAFDSSIFCIFIIFFVCWSSCLFFIRYIVLFSRFFHCQIWVVVFGYILFSCVIYGRGIFIIRCFCVMGCLKRAVIRDVP